MASQSDSQHLTWYNDAKFGLFIHWGAYSVAGAEASWPMMLPKLSGAMFGTQISITEKEYVALPKQFNPVNFNPDEWVRLAKEAGMRYIIITSKHHDGFCMFDAPGTDYKITCTPYGKDICLELAQACDRSGMPLGFYYSPPDMHHPGYRDTRKPVTKNWTGEPKRKEWNEYLDYMESHIRKLLTDYGEVAILWFDGLTNHAKYEPERFHKLIHQLSPKTLINDRLGDGYDYITPEQFIPKTGIPARTGKPNPSLDPAGDGFFRLVGSFSTTPIIGGWLRKQVRKYGEGTLQLTKVHQEPYPAPDHFQPWETCMTMGGSWAYNPMETNWKEPKQLVQNLVNVVSRGGNYLLNVGPTPQGTFPPEAIERLQHLGRWMKTYNESIYGSTYTPLPAQQWGGVTRKGDKVSLHIFNWPTNGKLVLESFPGSARSVGLVSGGSLAFRQEGTRLEIAVPPAGPDPDVSVLTVEIDPTEKGWSEYHAPIPATIEPKKYIKDQAVSSFIVNAVLNGLIAFCAYAFYKNFTYKQVATDILEAVFIITFLTSWIMVGSSRSEYKKGNITLHPTRPGGLPLPKIPVLRGLLIGVLCTIVWGGLLSGLAYLISPVEMNNWVYAFFKTIYTGLSGALASVLTVLSVVNDINRRKSCNALEVLSN
jgi:alpha-L-fucosidase